MIPGETGAVYLACWAATPYQHAGHYLGFAYPRQAGQMSAAAWDWAAQIPSAMSGADLTRAQLYGIAVRHSNHAAGCGARFLAVVAAAGVTWTVTRVWPDTTEQHEKWLKDLNNRRVLCPVCTPGTTRGSNPGTRQYRRKRASLK
jgi:hypothetical protein